MADLQINYEKLHLLANNARTLKDHLDDVVPGLGTNDGLRGLVTGRTQIGNAALFSKLNKFHLAWDGPFKDAMSKLDELAKLLDGVATKFFDMDADFAGKASNTLAAMRNSTWESQKAAYDHYLATKDKLFTYSYYDEHGQLVTKTRPLFDYSDPSQIPKDPGARPTSSTVDGTTTNLQYDDKGRVASETTSVSSPSGLSFSETTTYTYSGDGREPNGYTTKITHSDGSTETIVRTNNADGTYKVTDTTPDGTSVTNVTPKPLDGQRDTGYTSVTTDHEGKVTKTDVTNNAAPAVDTKVEDGPDGKTTYTGNADTNDWTLKT